jgi:flagellar protein FlaI
VEAVFNRLTTAPMSLPRSLVGSSLDCIVLQLKLKIGDRSVRRVVSVNEILGFDSRTNEMVMNEVYRWDPITDRIAPTGRSRLMDKIFQRYGIRPEEARRDLEGRKVFLEWLASKNYRSYKEVSAFVQEFYGNPYAMTSRARTELEARV